MSTTPETPNATPETISAIEKVAEDATFQVICAMQHIDWLRSVLGVLRDQLKQDPKLKLFATLADMGFYNASDWHHQLDVAREGFEAVLKEAGWGV